MKTKLKRSIKLGILIFGISTLSINCDKESISEQIEERSNFTEQGENKIIKTGKFNDIVHLKEFVNELKSNKNSLSRTTLEESNNFTIIEESDIFIYTDSITTTYTLAIEKENQNYFEFSNLVVQFSNDNPTTAFILNYVPSQDYLNAYILNDQEPFQGTVNYESLDYDGSLDNLAGRRICHTIKLSYCDYGGDTHAAGENCTAAFIFEVTYDICYESNSNEPLNESIDPPSSTGSGGGGTNSNPTKPLPSKTCIKTETGEVGITGNNGECFSAEALVISQQLEDILGEGDYFVFDDSANSSNSLAFNSVDDFEGYITFVENQPAEYLGSSSSIDGDTVVRGISFDIDPVLDTNIRVDILQELNDDEPISILNVSSYLQGVTSFREWTQNEEYGIETNVNSNLLVIQLKGQMKTGILIDGFGLYYTQTYYIRLEFDLTTGELIVGVITLIE